VASWWCSWTFEPAIVLPIAIAGALYAVGVVRLWHSARVGVGVRVWECVAFAGGWLALIVALLSPLHPLGEVLFSAHMAQHEVLMIIAAPLLAIANPLLAFVWGLPRPVRSAVGRFVGAPPVRLLWRAITIPFVAWAVHALALWVWHVPVLFEATLDSEAVHALQHLSFFGTALLFWWTVVRHRGVLGHGAATLYVFTTSVHTALLGALLTFARTVWYPAYTATAPAWGLTPLEDQQLGGLIMWIPAGAIYVIAALALIAQWLQAPSPSPFARDRVRAPMPNASMPLMFINVPSRLAGEGQDGG
jgi:putative membrane protein